MLDGPFAPWPNFTQEEADAVQRVLLSGRVNYWTGEECRAFEREFAQFAETRYAVAVANGTLALDVALEALGIGDGDEVIVTPRTFVASASSVLNAGAVPVFADVDAASQNITPDTVAPLIGPKTRAIVCVHLAGWPCEMDGLRSLADAHGLYLVEDCAQAHGARYRGRSVGGLGDVAAWSFCQDKIMTTGGEGGMITTNDEALWSRAWSGKDHGKSWHAVYEREHPPGFRWLHESAGTNARLTEMQAAIGRIQLGRMPDWHAQRAGHAAEIMRMAAACPGLRVPEVPAHIEHAWYKAYAFVRPEMLDRGWDRDRVIAEINARGVPCFSGSCAEVYREKIFAARGLAPDRRLPTAQALGQTSLMFLVHPTLTAENVRATCDAVEAVMGEATL
ncbi:DegT/DnrJ/EryC1/StrS family aminotransferase [Salinisphaera orenii]|uniref:Aminotransferase n=1 Tax=Salinisphaera orenii YIM 95161 TaxID=1051139 RepID=A0A423Q1N8_9GAMM|nr:DegT/DnrJ/EryC1/StrS aminotransferase family protein [Salinisphaera halophila]ROO32385.1 aminotransferase [Salinisphaera halophila YIM 95161]